MKDRWIVSPAAVASDIFRSLRQASESLDLVVGVKGNESPLPFPREMEGTGCDARGWERGRQSDPQNDDALEMTERP